MKISYKIKLIAVVPAFLISGCNKQSKESPVQIVKTDEVKSYEQVTVNGVSGIVSSIKDTNGENTIVLSEFDTTLYEKLEYINNLAQR